MVSGGKKKVEFQGQRSKRCEVCDRTLVVQRLARGCLVHRCPLCGHVVRDVRLCPAGARDQVYGGSEKFDRFRLFFTRRKLLQLLPQLAKPESLHVLEVGFGDGQLLRSFQRRNHQVYGVEVSQPQGLQVDQLRYLGAHLYYEGLERADLPKERLDLIYMIHVVEHLEDPLRCFRKLFAAARKGALIYLVTPNGRSAGLRIFGESWWHLEDPTHLRFFTPQSICTCLQKAGFSPMRVSAPLLDSITLEVNSLVRLFHRRGAVMDHVLVRTLDLLLVPTALLSRLLWRDIRPSMEILARRE